MASALREEIVEAMKAFMAANKGQFPTTLSMPLAKACDLLKMDDHEIPGVYPELMKRGVMALNDAAIFGMEVKIDYDGDQMVVS